MFEYRNMFNEVLCLHLAEIVNYHVRVNDLKFAQVVRKLNANGFKITYNSFKSTLQGNNYASYNFRYWSGIFEVLGIDINKKNFLELVNTATNYNKEYLKKYHAKRKKKD